MVVTVYFILKCPVLQEARKWGYKSKKRGASFLIKIMDMEKELQMC